jgi:hypothetical protein
MHALCIVCQAEATDRETLNDLLLAASLLDAVAKSVTGSTTGDWGSSNPAVHHIARALRDDTFSVFHCLPLFRHALVPSGFRFQVNRMAQKYSSELLLTMSGIQHHVPRRTVSVHSAPQYLDACHAYLAGDSPYSLAFSHRGNVHGALASSQSANLGGCH